MTENQAQTTKMYSLAEITFASYFGGPLVAGILARQNYIHIGKEKSGNWALIIGIVSTILILIGIFLLPEHIIGKIPSPLIPAIYTLIIYFLVKELQGKEIENHKKNNGEFYSMWNVLGISVICAVILAGVVLIGFANLPSSGFKTKKYGNAIKNARLETKLDSMSYAFGVYNFSGLKKDSIELDPMIITKAMLDGKEGKPMMDETLARGIIYVFFNKREQQKKANSLNEKKSGDATDNTKAKTNLDSLSYAFGIYNYIGLQRDSIDLDPIIIAKAMIDGKKGKALMDETFARGFIFKFLNEREMQKKAKEAEKNKILYKDFIAKGDSFLQKNREKPGVIVTGSGLQYEVIKMGTGPKPTPKDQVKVKYKGYLPDGTQFDASDPNKPPLFPITGMIKGWTEGLQLMPVGSKFKLIMPNDLAYGPEGRGNIIKPFSVLIFEVELLEIVK